MGFSNAGRFAFLFEVLCLVLPAQCSGQAEFGHQPPDGATRHTGLLSIVRSRLTLTGSPAKLHPKWQPPAYWTGIEHRR